MPTLTSTYLLPAILLNPAFILHIINTFVSHFVPPPPTISHSPHPFMESIGPVPGSTPYLDMHADDQLCWSYTAVMVVVQILAFGRVNDNRVRRKSAKAAKLEKERIRKEKLNKMAEERKPIAGHSNGHAQGLDGARDSPEKYANGGANGEITAQAQADERKIEFGSEEDLMETSEGSLTETSEEEMIV